MVAVAVGNTMAAVFRITITTPLSASARELFAILCQVQMEKQNLPPQKEDLYYDNTAGEAEQINMFKC